GVDDPSQALFLAGNGKILLGQEPVPGKGAQQNLLDLCLRGQVGLGDKIRGPLFPHRKPTAPVEQNLARGPGRLCTNHLVVGNCGHSVALSVFSASKPPASDSGIGFGDGSIWPVAQSPATVHFNTKWKRRLATRLATGQGAGPTQ